MDDFSDDGFDDLDLNTLQEIENNAIQFTQAQRPLPTQQQPALDSAEYNYVLEDDDLDDTLVIDELAQIPVRHNVEKPLPPQQQPRTVPNLASQQRWNPQPESSNARYQTPSQAQVPQRPYQPPPRLSGPAPLARPAPPQTQFARPPPPTSTRYTAQPSQVGLPNQQDDNVRELQARLRALETDLYTAKGEAALMRSKFETAQKSHDTEIARLKKLNAEQLAKQERAVEMAVAAEKTAATDLEFTRQDLKEVLNKSKKGKKDGEATTPRKGAGGRSNWDVADGFDDVELLPSPSKGQGRRNKDIGAVAIPVTERTPTKGKRKRPAVDSPVMALETHSDDVLMLDDSPSKAEPSIGLARQPESLPFDFLKLALDHHGQAHRPMTFDAFARYSFPTDPDRTFASIILHRLPAMGSAAEVTQLPVDFCLLLLEIWSQCLSEKYHEPIYDISALILYVLQLDTMLIAPRIMYALVPVAQTTISLLALPAFHSASGDLANHSNMAVQQLYAEIPTTEILSVLYLVALGCLSPPGDTADQTTPSGESAQVQFWRLMQITFVLMILSPKQAPDDFLGMLSLLRSSVLPDSIGPISDEPDKDVSLIASAIIDKTSQLLVDPPKWAPPRSYRAYEVRLELLRTLISFTFSQFGKRQLAQSDVAIPRLVTALSGAVDALYDMEIPSEISGLGLTAAADVPRRKDPTEGVAGDDPDATQDAASPAAKVNPATTQRLEMAGDEDPVPLLHAIISSTVALLHTLATDPVTANHANVPAKLAAFHGGSQRYLLTLARLNFAEEDLVLEAGIDAETVELAHELLEMAVTPDEGDGIGEVFGM
ncbi:uncharacterized protein E0L32_008756 [Thyridium curvatum]|uniref:DNA repair protein Rad26 n=1 Tax=Thyridium curvatum TaxID=1093900 RepID=A0A507AZR7_9PEZI|nr:uncharacterized protein E0L32_008756 [Thyridium curvatum]TPX10351.1 hypothetical protein E0L32_008756 [Thyridium curvatum]